MISFEDSKLTKKQYDFCLAYLETGNATESYRRAYNTSNIKPDTVNRYANELMNHPEIALTIKSGNDHLRQQVLVKKKYDLEMICDLIEEAIAIGRAMQDANVILKASDQLSKLHKLYDLSGDNSDDKSLSEKEKKLLARLAESKRLIDVTPIERK